MLATRPAPALRPRPSGLAARIGGPRDRHAATPDLLVLDIDDAEVAAEVCRLAEGFDVTASQRGTYLACQGPELLAFVRYLSSTCTTESVRRSRVVFPIDPEEAGTLATFAASHGFGIDAVLRPGADVLVPRFQPVIDLTDGSTIGFEGLIRGQLGDRTIPPTRLFSLARDVDRVRELDEAASTAILRAASGSLAGQQLFVNCTATTLDRERIDQFVTASALLDLPAEDLVLELTHTERVTRLDELLTAVDRARQHGLGIAIDEVGTGFDSAELLSRLRPDHLKVSMDLTQRLPGSASTIGALCLLADHLGAETILTGVETAEQEAHARSLGIRHVQGFRYGQPTARPTVEVVRCLS